MRNTVPSVLHQLGERAQTFELAERLIDDTELELKFQALEALAECDRPRTVRAMKEILRIFVD